MRKGKPMNQKEADDADLQARASQLAAMTALAEAKWVEGMFRVFAAVRGERLRQLGKWGVRSNRDKTAPDLAVWQLILKEEVGEAAKAVLEHLYDGKPIADVRAELVQVAAVACAIVQWLDTGEA